MENNAQVSQQELIDSILVSIANLAENNRDALITLLKNSGIPVSESSNYDELLESSLLALKDNAAFRENLSNYLAANVLASKESNFVDDELNFLNATSVVKNPPIKLDINAMKAAEQQAIKATAAQQTTKPKTGILSGLFTKQDIQQAIKDTLKFGTDLAKDKITQAANKGGEKRAIEFAKAEAERLRQLNIQQGGTGANVPTVADILAGKTLDDQKPKNKWVLPVAIGGGLLLVGAIIFFVTRKK